MNYWTRIVMAGFLAAGFTGTAFHFTLRWMFGENAEVFFSPLPLWLLSPKVTLALEDSTLVVVDNTSYGELKARFDYLGSDAEELGIHSGVDLTLAPAKESRARFFRKACNLTLPRRVGAKIKQMSDRIRITSMKGSGELYHWDKRRWWSRWYPPLSQQEYADQYWQQSRLAGQAASYSRQAQTAILPLLVDTGIIVKKGEYVFFYTDLNSHRNEYTVIACQCVVVGPYGDLYHVGQGLKTSGLESLEYKSGGANPQMNPTSNIADPREATRSFLQTGFLVPADGRLKIFPLGSIGAGGRVEIRILSPKR